MSLREITFDVLGRAFGMTVVGFAGTAGVAANLFPPFRQLMLKQIKSDLAEAEKTGFVSNVNEVAMMGRALSSWSMLFKFLNEFYPFMYNLVNSLKYRVGHVAPNPLVISESGESKPLHSFLPGAGKLLLLNLGSST